MTMKTMIENDEIMITGIRIPFILLYFGLQSNSLKISFITLRVRM